MKFINFLLSLTPASGIMNLFKSKTAIILAITLLVVFATAGYVLHQQSIIKDLKKDVNSAELGKAIAEGAAKSSDATVTNLTVAASAVDSALLNKGVADDNTKSHTEKVKEDKSNKIASVDSTKLTKEQVIRSISEAQINSVMAEWCFVNKDKCDGIQK